MAANDFLSSRVRTNAIIASGSNSARPSLTVYSASNASDSTGTITDAQIYTNVGRDIFLYVSGAAGTVDTSTAGSSLFGGDLVSSGTIKAITKVTSPVFSGSLTRLQNGTSYLIAGTSISITTGSSGAVTITNTGVTPPGGSDEYVQFNSGSTFSGSQGLLFNYTTNTLSGTIISSHNFSGSLTRIINGSSYLVAGTNIAIATASNGQVTIANTFVASPAGLDTQVQYNSGSAFSASAGLVFNYSTNTLTANNITGSSVVRANLNLMSAGGMTVAITPLTASAPVAANTYFYSITTALGQVTASLDATSTYGFGSIFVFKDTGGFAGDSLKEIVILPSGSQTIDGGTKYVIAVTSGSVSIIAGKNSKWFTY